MALYAVTQGKAAALLSTSVYLSGLSPPYINSALYCHNICTVQVRHTTFLILKHYCIQKISPII